MLSTTMDLADKTIGNVRVINTVRTFVDENTGRQIRQLTDFPEGAHLGYFRWYRQIPSGKMLAYAAHDSGNAILIDPETGDLDLLPYEIGALKVRERDGRVWLLRNSASKKTGKGKSRRNLRTREVWHIDLPDGEPVFDGAVPNEVPGAIEDITLDGKNLILCQSNENLRKYPIPTTKDVTAINHYFSRPRHGAIWVHNLETGATNKILQTQGVCPSHLDTSPADPTLLRYCLDMPDALGQRAWTIRTDGSDRRMIRPQEYGEMVTHEFWWADPNYIGYTCQDRRNDPTLQTHHWAEYSSCPTQLGIADLAGGEVYLSDPLNSYHTHIYRSCDGTLVSGEGTADNRFVHAAHFSMQDTKIQMIRLATTHTTFVPFRGQEVDCNFSADGKWLIYADKLGDKGPHQLFAVEVDL